ncbi:MAG: queuosine salvage family protein [Myxococcota bacterium]
MLVEKCRSLYTSLNHVAIDIPQLQRLASGIKAEDLLLPTWTDPWCIKADPEKTLSWIFIFNAINFSYWSERPWATQVRGKVFGETDPAFGVMAALGAALEHGSPLDQPDWLKQIDESDLKTILYPAEGFHPLPMLSERVAALQELGYLFAHYGGAIGILNACHQSATEITTLLNGHTDFWKDTIEFQDTTLNFAKRAWLVSGMIYGRFLEDPTRCIVDPEAIPCFSDYRLPQFLYAAGVLRYHSELQRKVIELEPLEYGTPEEVEIRIATQITAYELMNILKEQFPKLTYVQIDAYLWRNAVEQSVQIPPHHRMRGIAY